MNHLTVKELPITERPYEKCERYGTKMLSDAELLAVIIRTGSKNIRAVELAQKVLNLSEDNKGILGLNYFTIKELMGIKGIGKVKAIQLQCIAELTNRMAKASLNKKIGLSTPKIIADYYMQEMRHFTNEEIKLVILDTKNNLLKDMIISKGTINSSIISPREIFVEAIKYGAVYIVLIHNHPSGDPTPSKEDIIATKRIRDAGAIIGVTLIDHIIIGDNQYVSFRERELLF